jgi:hypothetical protein
MIQVWFNRAVAFVMTLPDTWPGRVALVLIAGILTLMTIDLVKEVVARC